MERKKRFALLGLAAVLSFITIICCTAVDKTSEVGYMTQASQQIEISQDIMETSQDAEEFVQDPQEYMFVWMSDTQGYSGYAPEVYDAMTEWIVKNAEEKNIKFVFHTGDVVDQSDAVQQWENADRALRKIDGVVPYSILAGNHDLLGEGDIYAAYLSHFGSSRFAGQANILWYKEGEASAQILETGGMNYLVLAIGFNPDEDTVAWANQILSKYRDIPIILTTHNYLRVDGTLSTTGERLYQEIVLKNSNIHLVLCGHNHNAEKNIVQIDDDGDGTTDRTVYQLLADYQETPGSGNGYMRLLTINEEQKSLHVTTYSPFLNDYHYFSTEENPGKDEFYIDMSDWF